MWASPNSALNPMSSPARLLCPVLVALTLLVLGACRDSPHPGEAGYPFNLAGRYASDMIVRDTRYTGSVELTTREGGTVSGTMKITAPIAITADLAGSVNGD